MQMNGVGGWFNRGALTRAFAPSAYRRTAPTRALRTTRFNPYTSRVRSVYQRAYQARRAALNGVDTSQYMCGLLSDIFSPSVAAFKQKVSQFTGSDVVKAAAGAYSAQQAAETAKAQAAAAQATQAAEEAKMVTAFSMPKTGISTPVMLASAAGIGGLLWWLSRRKSRA